MAEENKLPHVPSELHIIDLNKCNKNLETVNRGKYSLQCYGFVELLPEGQS